MLGSDSDLSSDDRQRRRRAAALGETPDSVFRELMEAVRADDPKTAVKQLLMAHRGSPYFEELFGEAKTMLLLEEYRRSSGRDSDPAHST